MKRLTSLLLAIAVLASFLAACAPPTPVVVEKEVPVTVVKEVPVVVTPTKVALPFEGKKLRILTWEGYVPDALKERFEKETGATLEITYISDNGELISKLRATGGEGWDIANPSIDHVAAAQTLYGIYQPLDLSRLKNVDNIFPALLQGAKDQATIDGDLYAIPFTWGTSGLIVNTEKVKEPITSYRQLCDPKYAGRVTYRFRWPTFAGASYGLGYDIFGTFDDPDKVREILEETLQYLIDCKPNVKAYWTTRKENIDLMLSEEAWLAQGWDGTGWVLSQENPAIKFIAPEEGALGWIDNFVIPSGAENLDLVYTWIDFNLQPEVGGMVMAGGGFQSAVQGAADYIDPKLGALIKESFPPEAVEKINWYPAMPPEIEEIASEMEERLKAAVGE